MKHTTFTVPAMADMEFCVTKSELLVTTPDNSSASHIHKTCEVYVNLSGDVDFAVEDRLYPISRGSVVITMPYEYHHCIHRTSAPHEYYWITFSAEQHQDFLRLFFDREKGVGNRIVLSESALMALCDVLDALMQGVPDPLDRRIHVLHFFQILAKGARSSQADMLAKLPADVAAVMEYVDHHLCEDLTVQTLAALCHVSVNTLERHFRESLGISPFAFIRKKRLLESQMLLRSGASVTDAAQKSGFSDYSNYIQLFRKHFGITPGRYKKRLEENT